VFTQRTRITRARCEIWVTRIKFMISICSDSWTTQGIEEGVADPSQDLEFRGPGAPQDKEDTPFAKTRPDSFVRGASSIPARSIFFNR